MSLADDKYGKRALGFVEDMQKLSEYPVICKRIVEELSLFGFEYVTIADVPGVGESPKKSVFLNTRPADFSDNYLRKNYLQRDPLMLALRGSPMPFAWNEILARKLSCEGRRIISEARDFGAHDGLLVPIYGSCGKLSLFSPCGKNPDLSRRARSALEMIGIYSYQALRRSLKSKHGDEDSQPLLTAREREVMKWVATGKSDDEIATILGITRVTATTHVENAKTKLNATRRTYAVVQALRSGQLTL